MYNKNGFLKKNVVSVQSRLIQRIAKTTKHLDFWAQYKEFFENRIYTGWNRLGPWAENIHISVTKEIFNFLEHHVDFYLFVYITM